MALAFRIRMRVDTRALESDVQNAVESCRRLDAALQDLMKATTAMDATATQSGDVISFQAVTTPVSDALGIVNQRIAEVQQATTAASGKIAAGLPAQIVRLEEAGTGGG